MDSFYNGIEKLHVLFGPLTFKEELDWYDGPILISFETSHPGVVYIAQIMDMNTREFLMVYTSVAEYNDYLDNKLTLRTIFERSPKGEVGLYILALVHDGDSFSWKVKPVRWDMVKEEWLPSVGY